MKYCKYNFHIMFMEHFQVPDFFGATFRGGFGFAFRKSVCVTKLLNCKDCLLFKNCPYSYIFETNILENMKYIKAPHPFVFRIPIENCKEIKPNDIFEISLLLFGDGINFFPNFLFALILLGEIGIGKNNSKFKVVNVIKKNKTIFDGKILTSDWKEPDELKIDGIQNINNISIKFLTPTKIIYKNSIVDVPLFKIIVYSIIRRLKLMNRFHNIELNENFDDLILDSENIQLKDYDLKCEEKIRYSNKERKIVKFKGFIGIAEYLGDLTSYFRLLKYGELINIGKATSFGFGRFKVDIL